MESKMKKNKTINVVKIKHEFEKGSIEEQIKAFASIKDYLSGLILEAQKAADQKANYLQEIYDNMVGTS